MQSVSFTGFTIGPAKGLIMLYLFGNEVGFPFQNSVKNLDPSNTNNPKKLNIIDY